MRLIYIIGQILRYKEFLLTYKTRGHRIKHLEDYQHLFPIKSSTTLAGIVADLICDGNLQGDPKWRIDFTSKSIKELKRFEKEMIVLFNIKGKIRKCTTNKFGKTYNIAFNCAPITRILFLCGVPAGQKVLLKFNIPKWIKKDKECFRRFAQRVFTCEGGLMHEKNRKMPQIRFNMHKEENIEDEFIGEVAKFLEKYFKIKSTIKKQKPINSRKDNKIMISRRMYITGENVIKFFNEIQFEGEKQKTLKAKLPNLA